MMVALTPDQLRALVRACRDQAVFHGHAAEQEEATGYHSFAEDDRAKAAYLTALADQLEDLVGSAGTRTAIDAQNFFVAGVSPGYQPQSKT